MYHQFGKTSVYGVFSGLMLVVFALLYIQYVSKKGELSEMSNEILFRKRYCFILAFPKRKEVIIISQSDSN